MEWGKATKNPVKDVRLARENNGRVRWLTEDEEARLLAHCGPQLWPLVITALHTGFRASISASATEDGDQSPRMSCLSEAWTFWPRKEAAGVADAMIKAWFSCFRTALPHMGRS